MRTHWPAVRAAMLVLGAALLISAPRAADRPAPTCPVPVGTWAAPGGARIEAAALIARLARESVVLLGEEHGRAEHHRWQLAVLSALAGHRAGVVLGLEMLPRSAQPVLDRWVAGELTEEQFLRLADWRNVWSVDAAQYLPILHYARMQRIPIVALNVSATLTRAVGAQGFDSVPADRREGVSRPAQADPAYVDRLWTTFREHPPGAAAGGRARDGARFRNFVDAQLVWDRAMAQAIADVLARLPGTLVVALMGAGHVEHGWGVPRQLEDLGVGRVAKLLLWEAGADCQGFTPRLADAVFGAAPPKLDGPPRLRLGVTIAPDPGGVAIRAVQSGSVAEVAGLRTGDLIVSIAGRPVRQSSDVTEAVARAAPGYWLPLRVLRGGEPLDLAAKFPPQP